MKRLLFLVTCFLLALNTDAVSAGNITKIEIYKAKRELVTLHEGAVLKRYAVSLGSDPIGPKTRQGDGKTPEGLYTITGKNAKSRYHKSLALSYPNAADRKRAARLGVSPGGDIMIHGLRNDLAYLGKFHLVKDWTQGCIAVTDSEIDELYDRVALGTPVEIMP